MRHTRPPTLETMRRVHNHDLWCEANLDAPLGVDTEAYKLLRSTPDAHPDDALDLCGIRVKAGYDDKKGYCFFGKLVKFRGVPLRWKVEGYDMVKDEVVVMSTRDRETVWFGNIDDYHAMWCVD